MQLSIVDMRAVLKARVAEMISKNASEDPVSLLAGVSDIRAILNEMENYAVEMVATKEQLENEAKADK